MLPEYVDILDRAGPPDWYDGHGCPRYGKFEPGMLSVYARVSIFYEIECQACRTKFRVAQSWGDTEMWGIMHPSGPFKKRRKPTAESLHYGDPPHHIMRDGRRCAGETMNCVDRRVIEWWEMGDSMNWRRQWKKQIELETDHSLPAMIDRVNAATLSKEK